MDEIKGIRIVSLTGEKEYGIEDSEVREELANVVDGAPEELDSFKEIADWITNDKTGAVALANAISANAAAITAERTRAIGQEGLLNNAIAAEKTRAEQAEQDIKDKAVEADSLNFLTRANVVALDYKTIVGVGDEITIPSATAESAGVMSAEDKVALDAVPSKIESAITEESKVTDEKITAEIDKIKDGDTIVGQAREIHSRNGKTVSDSFLVRTTAGSGTIGDGVASLKSVGGNIVKNLVDGTFESGWTKKAGNELIDRGQIVKVTPPAAWGGIRYTIKTVIGHIYYGNVLLYSTQYVYTFYNKLNKPNGNSIINKWGMSNTYGAASEAEVIFNITTMDTPEVFYCARPLFIDLTEMFGAGKEPDKATCDRLFGTMDALPQGLTVANPTEFKSTGFNQFNPDNVLEGKAIVDNAIVPGDKKIAVISCLPCKVGTGENNGYCIHGEFGDGINVYLTPLNPMEVEGELYMHKLSKDATTDTYVPLIKGYLLVEVPTTANLCAHFLWSEDKCKRDTYEPYFESKVKLPTIPQMSEWGLAGIQAGGTLICDEIDFDRGVYVKRIGSVDLGTLSWQRSTLSGVFFAAVNDMLSSNILSSTLGTGGYCINYTTVIKNYGSFASIPDKNIVFGSTISAGETSIVIQDLAYDNVSSFSNSVKGNIAYYILATPEEYPLPKVDNNYISSDYGVEQFDSVVPCNANNLYYMRSLAGETRNFLDRMYANIAKSDAKEVADYITNNLADKIPLATAENNGLMSAEDNKNLNTIIAFEFARVIGRTINPASGVFASVEGAGYLGVIPVKSGEKYLYSGRATQYNVGVAAYDENRAYLYPIICNVENAVIKKDVCVDEPFTIPEGVAYIAVGTRYQESNPVSIKRVYSPKELVDRKVPQLVSYDITDGYIVNTANGNVGAVAGSAVGSFIKVTEGEEFLITAKWGSQTGIAGYDKDKNYIIRLADATLSTFYSAVEVSDYLIRIPQGVEYIRGCTTDAVNYPLKVAKLVSIEDLTEKIPLCQNQFSYAWFGDSISQFGIPENVERKLGSSILDCSFAGAPLTYSTEQYQGTGFMTIASCIKNGDYTQIDNALQLQSGSGTDITEKLVNLQHIKDANWKAISHFVVMAGTNDLSFSGATIDNIKAGLRQAFKDVISAYPHITIYFVSPPFRGNINSAAGNGLDLLEINEAIEDVCKEFNFPFLDFFHNCGVNQYNKGYYLDAQELHPNANGLALWSSKLANWLKSI